MVPAGRVKVGQGEGAWELVVGQVSWAWGARGSGGWSHCDCVWGGWGGDTRPGARASCGAEAVVRLHAAAEAGEAATGIRDATRRRVDGHDGMLASCAGSSVVLCRAAP